MDHVLLTAAVSFLGTFAAIAAYGLLVGRAPAAGCQSPALAPSPRTRLVTLVAVLAFALIAAAIFYLISVGHMVPGLGLIAGLVTLFTLTVAVRAMR